MVLNPYGLLLKTAAVCAVLFAAFGVGCRHGVKTQAARDAKAIAFKDDHLRAASRALSANARTFRAMDRVALANKKIAEAQWDQARKDDKEAVRVRGMLEQRIREIADEAEREKFTCSIAEARICGTPLR